MKFLPRCDQAILDIRKIAEYCLNPLHPSGRHKARVFAGALGLQQADSEWLRRGLLDAIRSHEAVEVTTDEMGVQWRVDVSIERQRQRAVVRTVWIVRRGEEMPRFVTCWVL